MTYILVDCFDTLFHRRNSNESTLYDWARMMARHLNYKYDSVDLYKIRKKIENVLINKGYKEEATYKELIEVISQQLGVDYMSFYECSFTADLESEKNQLYIDKENLKRIIDLKEMGNKVFLVSDFYMPREFFEHILSYFKIRYIFDELYISSEIGLRKSSGNIYQYILNKHSINSDEFIMIGDNKESDINNAKAHNIKTVHVPYEKNTKAIKSLIELKNNLRICLKVNNAENLFSGFNSGVLLFCQRLYNTAKSNGVKKLLFCAREGQLLKIFFDIYQEEFCFGNKIETEYLYVSRRSTLIPSLKDIKNEKFDRIFRQYIQLTLKDFLRSIGFDTVEIETMSDYFDVEAVVSKESNTLTELFSNNEFIDKYNRKRIKQRENIIKYFEEVNGNLKKIDIVDIGWKGTIQDNLFDVFAGESSICGYYFGLFGYESCENNKKIGLMFDLKKEMPNNSLFSYNHIKLESVCVANHASVQGYMLQDDKIKIVMSDSEKLSTYEMIKPNQNIMIKRFKQLCLMVRNSPFDVKTLENFLEKKYMWFQCINMPRYRYLFEKIDLITEENFGNISKNANLARQVKWNIHREQSREYAYIYATYKLLDKLHLKFLYPIASLYCVCTYFIKRLSLPER